MQVTLKVVYPADMLLAEVDVGEAHVTGVHGECTRHQALDVRWHSRDVDFHELYFVLGQQLLG